MDFMEIANTRQSCRSYDEKIRAVCGTNSATRLVITLGYAAEGDKLRQKKRKELGEFVRFVG